MVNGYDNSLFTDDAFGRAQFFAINKCFWLRVLVVMCQLMMRCITRENSLKLVAIKSCQQIKWGFSGNFFLYTKLDQCNGVCSTPSLSKNLHVMHNGRPVLSFWRCDSSMHARLLAISLKNWAIIAQRRSCWSHLEMVLLDRVASNTNQINNTKMITTKIRHNNHTQ